MEVDFTNVGNVPSTFSAEDPQCDKTVTPEQFRDRPFTRLIVAAVLP